MSLENLYHTSFWWWSLLSGASHPGWWVINILVADTSIRCECVWLVCWWCYPEILVIRLWIIIWISLVVWMLQYAIVIGLVGHIIIQRLVIRLVLIIGHIMFQISVLDYLLSMDCWSYYVLSIAKQNTSGY